MPRKREQEHGFSEEFRGPMRTISIFSPSSPNRALGAIAALRATALLMALALMGCGEGFETTTSRGFGVKEWHLRLEGGKIEAVAVWPPGKGPWPALLLIHSGKGRAQRFSRSFLASRAGASWR